MEFCKHFYSSPKHPQQERKKREKKALFFVQKKNKTKKADTFSHFEGGPCAVIKNEETLFEERKEDTRTTTTTTFFATRETRAAIDVGTREAFWRRESARGWTFRGARATRREGFRNAFFTVRFFSVTRRDKLGGTASTWNTFVIPRSLPNTETPKRVGCCALRRAREKRERERESRRDGEERGAAFRRLVVDALYSFSYVVGKNLVFPIIERKSRIRDPSLSCGIKRL